MLRSIKTKERVDACAPAVAEASAFAWGGGNVSGPRVPQAASDIETSSTVSVSRWRIGITENEKW